MARVCRYISATAAVIVIIVIVLVSSSTADVLDTKQHECQQHQYLTGNNKRLTIERRQVRNKRTLFNHRKKFYYKRALIREIRMVAQQLLNGLTQTFAGLLGTKATAGAASLQSSAAASATTEIPPQGTSWMTTSRIITKYY